MYFFLQISGCSTITSIHPYVNIFSHVAGDINHILYVLFFSINVCLHASFVFISIKNSSRAFYHLLILLMKISNNTLTQIQVLFGLEIQCKMVTHHCRMHISFKQLFQQH